MSLWHLGWSSPCFPSTTLHGWPFGPVVNQIVGLLPVQSGHLSGWSLPGPGSSSPVHMLVSTASTSVRAPLAGPGTVPEIPQADEGNKQPTGPYPHHHQWLLDGLWLGEALNGLQQAQTHPLELSCKDMQPSGPGPPGRCAQLASPGLPSSFNHFKTRPVLTLLVSDVTEEEKGPPFFPLFMVNAFWPVASVSGSLIGWESPVTVAGGGSRFRCL